MVIFLVIAVIVVDLQADVSVVMVLVVLISALVTVVVHVVVHCVVHCVVVVAHVEDWSILKSGDTFHVKGIIWEGVTKRLRFSEAGRRML